MENVILIVHLIIALCLIVIVLLQRSEGGGLGIGGGGGAATGRPPATAMTKLTWAFGAAFVVTSVTLTIISAQNSAGSSVLDLTPPVVDGGAAAPVLPNLGDNLLPPSTGDAPLTPPRAE